MKKKIKLLLISEELDITTAHMRGMALASKGRGGFFVTETKNSEPAPPPTQIHNITPAISYNTLPKPRKKRGNKFTAKKKKRKK